MKKTIISLAVLTAATSVQAAEVYNEDKLSVSLLGDFEVLYKRDTNDGDDFKQIIDDADLGFDVRYQANNNLDVGGYVEVSAEQKSDSNDAVQAENAYIGLYSKSYGDVRFGRLDTVLDDAGIGNDYQFGLTNFFADSFNYDEAVRYDIEQDSFYASVALAQNKNGHVAGDGLDEDGLWVDAKLGAKFDSFELTGYLANRDNDDDDSQFFGVEGRYYGFDNLDLAAAFYHTNLDENDVNVGALSADYTNNAWLFSAGVSFADRDDDNETSWYVNGGYEFAPSTVAYAELGGNSADDSQVGVAIGVKLEF